MKRIVSNFVDWVIKMINETKYGYLNWFLNDKLKYREFKNADEARNWGMIHYKRWAKQYKNVMHSAMETIKVRSLCSAPLECYCGYSYRQINQFLRNGSDTEYNTYRELSDILSIVLCSAPRIPCNLVLYRLVNDEFIEKLIENNKNNIQTPVQEKGFMSTSLLKNIVNEMDSYATGNNLLKIYVKQGTIGVYVNAVTKRSEEEMLLLPNMYLGLSSYPYKDKQSRKIIFECQLINFNN